MLRGCCASIAAVVDGDISSISLADYMGKYVVLFFYPKGTKGLQRCRCLTKCIQKAVPEYVLALEGGKCRNGIHAMP